VSYVVQMFPDNRIRELRKKAGLTQHQLGEKVGLHQTQIGNIENGARALTLEWSRRIADALGVKVADLLSEQDNPWRLSNEEQLLLQNFRDAAAAQKALISRVAEPLPKAADAKNAA
jgi:transcriptional regulator with XRE-family HTH domain